jgi:hypothetical protein
MKSWSLILTALAAAPALAQIEIAKGTVFEDRNKNGRMDRSEPGIAGVKVSNGSHITTTDRNGRWSLAVDNDDIIFVIKPRGYMTPLNSLKLPQFYYIHKPNGSPSGLRFPGVSPTGPLPEAINFPLHKASEPDRFFALFFGDTQSRNAKEVDYLTRDIIEPLIGSPEAKGAKFGVTLGDIVFDDLSVFDPHNRAIALLGLPWYNVLGNHDINFDVDTDDLSDETFESIFGPNYYSFDYGTAHFVVLDNVHYTRNAEGRGGYVGRFGEQQLRWLKRDLSMIPKDQLVVMMMHIPLDGTEDKEEIFKLIGDRPYSLSVSAHTHFQEHRFLTSENLKEPHHHIVNVTTCGSWWSGRPDERGIPHTTMRDGAPNGYSIFSFDGRQYSIQFRAAGAPAAQQMNIYAPDIVKPGEEIKIYANIYGGSKRSKVELRFGDAMPWVSMDHVLEPDPEFVKLFERDRQLQRPFYSLPEPINSPHLWSLTLRTGGLSGTVPIHIRTTDMFGQVSISTRAVRIEG